MSPEQSRYLALSSLLGVLAYWQALEPNDPALERTEDQLLQELRSIPGAKRMLSTRS